MFAGIVYGWARVLQPGTDALPRMRILFLTGSPARYMAPPQLGEEQINAGPDWSDAHDSTGKLISLRTPVGQYDIKSVLARIPVDQQPDAIVSLVDASWRNQPCNLEAFAGPKALLVADTHHLASPLIGMFKHAASERYDRIVFLYDRHHLGFFQSAGFQNLYWFPGLTFPHSDTTVASARAAKRAKRIAFVGQAGNFHPQRARLLAALKEGRLPLDQRSLPQLDALAFYGGSQLGFNASLNGDLNLRVFEIIAAGATLLTDRLSAESGLFEIFGDGREILTYRNTGELAELAAHALAHPPETAAIGAAGAKQFDHLFNATRRRTSFQELLVNGTAVPEFSRFTQTSSRTYFAGDTSRLLGTMMVYEGLQEMHRTDERVRVILTPAVSEDIAAAFATLPRVEITRDSLHGPGDLAVFTRDDDIIPSAVQAPRIWCCDALPEEHGTLNDYFSAVGFTPVSEDVAVLCRVQTAAAAPSPLDVSLEKGRAGLQSARAVLVAGKTAKAIELIKEVLKSNPKMIEAWRLLVDTVLPLNHPKVALGALTHLLSLEPNSARDWNTRAELLVGLQRLPEALSDLLRAAHLAPDDRTIQAHLARVALSLRLPVTARAALDALVRLGGAAEANAPLKKSVEALEAEQRAKDTGAPGYDLVITHNEVCRMHGTGVLLERYLGGSDRIVTLRSQSHYEGKTDLPAQHLILEAGLPEATEEKLMSGLLANFPIRRILCVPYYEADVRHAVLAQRLTGAPLCAYVMDDQTIHARGIRAEVAQRLFDAANLRLVISPEMQVAYQDRFNQPFSVMPPLLASSSGRRQNRWQAAPGKALRAALVGNIWSAQQFAQLRRFVRLAGLQIDWYGNAKVAWLPADPKEYEADGIFSRGFLPESELAAKLVDYPFVVVPSGQLDGSENNEWLTRLSLPSRMVFILGQAMTPMLVLGHPDTAASQFVTRFGFGTVVPYNVSDPRAAIQPLVEADSRARIMEAISSGADKFVVPDAGEWIWRSLAAGEAEPLPCDVEVPASFPVTAKVA